MLREGAGTTAANDFEASPRARSGGTDAQHQARLEGVNDARTGMAKGIPMAAMCVQRFDDSLNSAIHTTYRISLRSSSMPEPRDPLLKVVIILGGYRKFSCTMQGVMGVPAGGASPPRKLSGVRIGNGWVCKERRKAALIRNDPSAGSPTETLLRLLLPLNDRV